MSVKNYEIRLLLEIEDEALPPTEVAENLVHHAKVAIIGVYAGRVLSITESKEELADEDYVTPEEIFPEEDLQEPEDDEFFEDDEKLLSEVEEQYPER